MEESDIVSEISPLIRETRGAALAGQRGNVGRPRAQLRGASLVANDLARLMRDLSDRAGLSLRVLATRLSPADFPDGRVPAVATLSRRLNGDGLNANHGALVHAVIKACAPPEEVEAWLERAGEMLAELRAQPPAEGTSEPSPAADYVVSQLQKQLEQERELRARSEANVAFLLGRLSHPGGPPDVDRLVSLQEELEQLRARIDQLSHVPDVEPVTPEQPERSEQPVVAPLSSNTDAGLSQVAALLRHLDPDGRRTATAVREALDGVIDGPRTGRYSLKQLLKSEKSIVATQVERAFQRAFGLADGNRLDLSIDGVEVDFKFAQNQGRWLLGPQSTGRLVLLLYANEDLGQWGLALGRVTDDLMAPGSNRDGRSTLRRDRLDSGLVWLFRDEPLQRNVLTELDEEDRQEIFAQAGSIGRLMELARRSRGRPISRTALATVVMQVEPARRLRDVQPKLAKEGFFLFHGGRADDRRHIEHLGLPELAADEIAFPELVSVDPETATKPFVELAGGFWSLASG